MKRILSFLLSLAMIFSMLPVSAFAAEEQPEETTAVTEAAEETTAPAEETTAPAEETTAPAAPAAEEGSEPVQEQTVETGTYVPTVSLADSDTLLEGWLYKQFYGGISLYGVAAREQLTDAGKVLYDGLKAEIEKIAAGEETSAKVTAVVSSAGATSIDDFQVDVVLDALLHDCPYELYWYDKTDWTSYGWSTLSDGTIYSIDFIMPVVEDLRGDGYSESSPVADVSGVNAANAAENAQAIVTKYAGLSTYEKLAGFKNEICALVEYNDDAAASMDFSADADPWQLLWVFDGDDTTDVVCEGYSKAFQYLCDLDGTIDCYTVTGEMAGGGHMWNIVTLNGENYLVDVTNSESSTVGNDGTLFLAGGEGDVTNGYTLVTSYGDYLFTYDEAMTALWGTDGILVLSGTAYDPDSDDMEPIEPTATEPEEEEYYTLSFVNNYPTMPEEHFYSYTDGMIVSELPEAASVDGYTFVGWFSGENGTGSQISQGDTWYATMATTWYAYYEETVDNTAMTQAEFAAAIAEAASSYSDYYLTRPVEITEYMEINAGINVIVAEGGSITVQSCTLYIVNGSCLVIDGGTVTVNGTLRVDYSSLNVQSGTLAVNGTLTMAQGAGFLTMGTTTVTGVDTTLFNAYAYPTTSAELAQYLAAASNYNNVYVNQYQGFTLEQDVTIKNNTRWGMYTLTEEDGFTVTVPSGVTVTNNGTLSVDQGCSLIVEAGGTLFNNSLMNISGVYNNYGSEINSGTISREIYTAEGLNSALAAAQYGDSVFLQSSLTLEAGDFIEVPYGVSLYLNGGLTVPAGATLYLATEALVSSNQLLDIQSDASLQNYGTVKINAGTFNLYGNYYGSGDILYSGGTLNGIDESQVIYSVWFSGETEEELLSAIADAEDYAGFLIDGYWPTSLTITGDLEIPEGSSLNIGSGRVLVIASGASLTINGDLSISSYAQLTVNDGATAVCNGTITNNGGTISGSIEGYNLTQEAFEAELNEAIASGAYSYYLRQPVVLTSDFVFNGGTTLFISDGGSITVPSGVTMSVNSQYSMVIAYGGSVTVQSGGLLEVPVQMGMQFTGGTLTMESGALLNTVTGGITVTLGQGSVSGIDTSLVEASAYPTTAEELASAYTQGAAYSAIRVCLESSITLDRDVTIPENGQLDFYNYYGDEVILTVPSGYTLTNNGFINVNAGYGLVIEAGGTLVNNLYINVSGGTYTNEGTEVNNGTINVVRNITTAEELALALEEAAATASAQSYATVYLRNALTLESGDHIVIPSYVSLNLNNTLTLESGSSLTVSQSAELMTGIYNSDALVVNSGAELHNYSFLYLHAGNAVFAEDTYIGYEGSHIDLYPYATVSGIDPALIDCIIELADEAGFAEALEQVQTGEYGSYSLFVTYGTSNFTISGTYEIPANVTLEVYNGTNFELLSGADVTNNGTIYLFYNSALTIAEDAVLTNNGNIYNYEATITGTITGEQPITGGYSDMETVSDFASLKEALSADETTDIYIGGEIELTSSLTVDSDRALCIPGGTSLVVPSGKTLTVKSNVYIYGGSIVIEAGGKLAVAGDGWIQNISGVITNEGTVAIGASSGGIWEYIAYGATSTGIDKSKLHGIVFAESFDDVLMGLAAAEEGYGVMEVVTCTSFALTESITIPENAVLGTSWSDSFATVTVPAGVTLTNEGFLAVYEGSELWVRLGGALVNNGSMEVWGTYTNNGTHSGADAVLNEGGEIYVGDPACGDDLTVKLEEGVLTISGTGDMYNYTNEMAPWYAGDMHLGITEVVIEEGVTGISGAAFALCTALETVTVASTVTSIGGYAFQDCSALTQITFLGGAPEIDETAFYGVTATVNYPVGWTEEELQDYGGSLTWQVYGDMTQAQFEALLAEAEASGTEAVVNGVTVVLTENLAMTADVLLLSGASMYVAEDAVLTVGGSMRTQLGSSMILEGTLDVQNEFMLEGELTSFGQINVSGMLYIEENAVLTMQNRAVDDISAMYVSEEGEVVIRGKLNSNGSIENNGIWNVDAGEAVIGGTMTNYGNIYIGNSVGSVMTVDGTLTNNGIFYVYGYGNAYGDGLTNGILNISGALINDGRLWVYGEVNVSGALSNNLEVSILDVSAVMTIADGAVLINDRYFNVSNYGRLLVEEGAVQKLNENIGLLLYGIIEGVSDSNLDLDAMVYSEEDLYYVLMEQAVKHTYSYEHIRIYDSITFDGIELEDGTVATEMVVPEQTILRIMADYGELLFADGTKLTNNGGIVIVCGSSLHIAENAILENNGTIDPYDGYLIVDGEQTGEGTVEVPEEAWVTTESELQAAIAMGVETIYVQGAASYAARAVSTLTLTQDLTIPEGTTVVFQGIVLNVPETVTVTIDGSMVISEDTDVVVDGVLVNNAGLQLVSGSLTFGETGSYAAAPDAEVSVEDDFAISADVVPVDSITLYAGGETDSITMVPGDTVTIEAVVLPELVSEKELVWELIQEDDYVALDEAQTLTALAEGTAVLKVSAADGSGADAELTVTVSGYGLRITADSSEVLAGKSIKLTADWIPENLTGTSIDWSLENGGESFADLKPKGNTATITAADVTEVQTVTVLAESADGEAVPARFQLTIIPKVKSITLRGYEEEDGYEFEVPEDQLVYPLTESRAEGFDLLLRAEASPNGASSDVTWTSGTKKVAYIVEEEDMTDEELAIAEMGYVRIRFTGAVGSTKLTAAANDGSKVKTILTVKTVADVEPVAGCDTVQTLVAGTSTTLKIKDALTGKAVNAKHIEWYIDGAYDADGEYISRNNMGTTIDAKGKLNTRNVTSYEHLEIYGDVYVDGCYMGDVFYEITVYPKTTAVELYQGNDLVTGSTLPLDIANETSLRLSALQLPLDAKAGIDWKSSNPKIATVTDGVVTYAGKTGTVTITATANDGSGKKATVKVEVGRMLSGLTASASSETLNSKASATLTAYSGDGDVTRNVTWSIVEGAAYAKLSGSKLTAKTVTAAQKVTVVATSKDAAHAVSEPVTITILPKNAETLNLKADGELVTGATLNVQKGDTIGLSAWMFFSTTEQMELTDVTWSSKKTSVATVSPASGSETTVTVAGTGSTVITATGYNSDGKKVTATVTIKSGILTTGVTVTSTVNTVGSGKSITLKAGTIPAKPTTKGVVWSLAEGDEAYAKISSSGKLTAAKGLNAAKQVTVIVQAKDGASDPVEIPVTITPLATGVDMFLDGSYKVTGTTMTWFNTDELELSAMVYPFYDYGVNRARNASQSVKWKSSNPKILSIDEKTGQVTFGAKTGSVTITATAKDGSGKKATLKLKVMTPVTELSIRDGFIAGGKTLKLSTLTETITADATDKTLAYYIYDGDGEAFATLNNGKLKTQKVTAPKTLEIYAFTVNGYKDTFFTVTITPATTKVELQAEIYGEWETVTGKTIELEEGKTLQIMGRSAPNGACEEYDWKVSNVKQAGIVEGDELVATATGNAIEVEGIAVGKTVTITATAKDGTNKKVTMKVKIVERKPE